MGVERRQHPADCAVDQLFSRDRFNVVLLHDCEHARERIELLVGVVRERLGSANGDLLQDEEACDQRNRQRDGPSMSFNHSTLTTVGTLDLSRSFKQMPRADAYARGVAFVALTVRNYPFFESSNCCSASLTSGRDQSNAPIWWATICPLRSIMNVSGT